MNEALRQNGGVPTMLTSEVHVWYQLTGDLGDADLARFVSLLSSEELARCERFRFTRDRRDYAAAHALLRSSLSRYAALSPASWTFREADGGKPMLAAADGAPRLSFNLSHTHGLVACAIAGGADIGVDVESADRDVDDAVAERFFSPREHAGLRACGPGALRARRFIELWTLKESYVKAIGKGLSHPLDSIVFEIDDARHVRFMPPPDVDSRAWTFCLSAPAENYRLAVAVRHASGAPPRIQIMPADV
jgi:4'-phosphopantetheinyl transferase